MGMDVDESGRDDLAARVDFLPPSSQSRTDRGDEAAVDRNVGLDGRAAGAINHESVANHHVVHLVFSLFYMLAVPNEMEWARMTSFSVNGLKRLGIYMFSLRCAGGRWPHSTA